MILQQALPRDNSERNYSRLRESESGSTGDKTIDGRDPQLSAAKLHFH
jgi:hypothetical protein